MEDQHKETPSKIINQGGQSPKQIDLIKKQEQELLFSQADLMSPAYKKIDNAELVQLANGEVIDLAYYILETYAEKSKHFYMDTFYFPIADLMGESRSIMHPFVKPLIVPELKRKLIYGRFPNAVQRRIAKKNPYTGYCTRAYFNYQCLTKDADILLRGYINDFEKLAAETISKNGNLKSFVSEYCTTFGLPEQLEFNF